MSKIRFIRSLANRIFQPCCRPEGAAPWSAAAAMRAPAALRASAEGSAVCGVPVASGLDPAAFPRFASSRTAKVAVRLGTHSQDEHKSRTAGRATVENR